MVSEQQIAAQYEVLLNVPGFMDVEAFRMLFALRSVVEQPNAAALEIGVFCGRSLLGLACAFSDGRIVGVDPLFPDLVESPAYPDEARFLKEISGSMTPEARIAHIYDTARTLDSEWALGIEDRIELRRETQDEFLGQERGDGERFAICYLDGEHTFTAVESFLSNAERVLSSGAVLIVDDYCYPGFPEIAEALHVHSAYRRTLRPVMYIGHKVVLAFRTHMSDTKRLQDSLAEAFPEEYYATRRFMDGAVFASPRDMGRLMPDRVGHRG